MSMISDRPFFKQRIYKILFFDNLACLNIIIELNIRRDFINIIIINIIFFELNILRDLLINIIIKIIKHKLLHES